MTTPRKRTPEEVWRALEKMSADDDLEQLDAQSDEEVDRVLLAAGLDPKKAAKLGEMLLAKGPPGHGRPSPPRVVAPPPRRRQTHWIRWASAAALAALGVGMALEQQGAFVGHGRPDPTEHVDQRTPAILAAQLRDEGYAACDQGHWSVCEQKLNAASALDPAGDADPRVTAARKAVFSAITPPTDTGAEKPKSP